MPGARVEIEEYPAAQKWEAMVEATDASRNSRIIRVMANSAEAALEEAKAAYYLIRPWERPDAGRSEVITSVTQVDVKKPSIEVMPTAQIPLETPDAGNVEAESDGTTREGGAQVIQTDAGPVTDDSGQNPVAEVKEARRAGWYADPTPRSAMRERGRR